MGFRFTSDTLIVAPKGAPGTRTVKCLWSRSSASNLLALKFAQRYDFVGFDGEFSYLLFHCRICVWFVCLL